MYTALLNTAGNDYNSIIQTQQEEYYKWPHWVYWPSLNLDWSKALIRIYTNLPNSDTVLSTFDTEESSREYIAGNIAEWDDVLNWLT